MTIIPFCFWLHGIMIGEVSCVSKQRFLVILIALLLIVICGASCGNVDEIQVGQGSAEEERTENYELPSDADIVEIPPEQVKGITQEDAQQLCYFALGEKDKETGFPFSFGVTGAVEAQGHQYYVIRASWLVNNDHLSYIGDFFVRADGNVIFDGAALSDSYTMTSIVWSK